MISIILAQKIFSLFIIIFMGFLLVKSRILKPDDSRILSVVTLYIINPCIILSSFQVEYSPHVRDGLLLALAASVIVHVLMIVFTEILGKLLSMDAVEKMSVIYTNAGNLVIPLVLAVLGKEWIIYTSAFLAIQTALIWSHGKLLLCGEKKIDVKKIFANINIIAILIGLVMFFGQIHFPAQLQDSIDMTSTMIGPMVMIVIGMLIGGMDMKKLFSYHRILLMLFIRLILYSLAAVLLFKYSGLASLVPDGHTILLVTLIATITPTAACVTQMAQVYGQNADYASAINIVSTLSSIITMPLMVMIYQL